MIFSHMDINKNKKAIFFFKTHFNTQQDSSKLIHKDLGFNLNSHN